MTADPDACTRDGCGAGVVPATQAASACCLERWTCEAQPGLVRGDMRGPCGFELAATVEGCPKRGDHAKQRNTDH